MLVPPSRIHLLNHEHGCKVELKGGQKEEAYILLNNDNSLTSKTYVASKPSKAAIKAYYSLIRNMNSVIFEDMNYHLLNEIKDEKFLKSARQSKMPPKLEIKLMKGKKIYNYYVEYVCNVNPNSHELKHCITKIAKATKFLATN
jgi:hypothetical protein